MERLRAGLFGFVQPAAAEAEGLRMTTLESHQALGSDPSSADEASPNATHPGCPVRHSYPLAIGDASWRTALELLGKTLPFALVRFGILVGVSLLTIVWLLVTLGGAGLIAAKVPLLGLVWLAAGGTAYGWAWFAVVRYGLYLLRAGHIAVLTELITKGSIGNGQEGMFAYGKSVVTGRFGQVSVLFALDALIDGILRALNRTLNFAADLLPIPGLSGVASVTGRILHSAATYVDETLLSYSLARGDENAWQTSRDGLVYYAQNSKEILKTAVGIVALDYVSSVVVWVVMLAPAFVVGFLLPAEIAGGGTLFTLFIAVLLASNVRAAFLKPLFLTMIMIKFHMSVKNQPINEQWDARLCSLSDKFRELKDKAQSWQPTKAPNLEEAPSPAS